MVVGFEPVPPEPTVVLDVACGPVFASLRTASAANNVKVRTRIETTGALPYRKNFLLGWYPYLFAKLF